MCRRLVIIFAVLLVALSEASAQYDANYAHYWAMETSFNPAAVGKENVINVAAAYNNTLTGFENNPRTMYASADLPFFAIGSFHGVGGQFQNDQIGLFKHTKMAVQYAYKRSLLGGVISAGVQIGMLSEKFDGTKVDTETPNDPAFPSTEVDGSAFDIGVGLYYTHGNAYAGVSVHHLNSPTVELGERQDFKIEPAYYFTAGYNIKLKNPFISIQPSALVQYDGSAYRADITARVKYTNDKKMLYAGVGCSPTNSVTALIGGNFHGIHIGYSYEVYTSAISFGNGSHELFIGYQTDINFAKRGRNLHKSVRLL
ncbi:MAG: type IX secretion system membrane protein PorP/SprF [Prevotella sp.]|nr:type IX secretion system membrane protein PorP/SprF [Prevotella sp.]